MWQNYNYQGNLDGSDRWSTCDGLQTMLGLLMPSSGSVTSVGGPEVGCMPQSLSLHLYFSVREILQYYAGLGGLSPHLTPGRISTVLQFLHLSDKVRGGSI